MTQEETAEILEARKRAYQLAFSSPAGQAVLIDLASFCRAAETCAVPGDHDRTFMLLGRNEVFLRIQQHMNLTPEHLFRLFTGQPFDPGAMHDRPTTAATATATAE